MGMGTHHNRNVETNKSYGYALEATSRGTF